MSYADPVDALLLPPGHGEGLWHLDTLWTFKIPATASEVTFFIDDEQHTAGPGSYVFGPRGRAHTHRVESDTARLAILLFPALVKPSSAPPGDRPDPTPSHRRSSPT
jgi:hypothetical protein